MGALGAPPASRTLLDYRKELGLSERQVAAIKQAVVQFQHQAVDLDKQIQAARTALREAPETEAKARQDQLEALQRKLEEASRKAAGTIQTTLTAPQLQKWRQLQADFARSQSK